MSLSSIEDKNIKLFENQSYIDGKIIYDKDILNNIGYDNYVMLSRKYPNYFKFFPECSTVSYDDYKHPGMIELITEGNVEKIKIDIIKTIYYGKRFSINSDLVIDKKNFSVSETEDSLLIWIFICIIIVSLLFFSLYIIYISKIFNEKINNIKFTNL